MSNAAATPDLPVTPNFPLQELSAGAVLVDLGAGAAGDDFTPPAIIRIAPRGKTQTRDDRAYDFKPEVLVARFDQDGIDLPIDMEHALTSFAGDKSKGACGWITRLEARADGLYGHVDWLKPAIAALKARTHRYISPTFRHDEFGQATWLHSAALVAAPALAMPALATAQLTEPPTMTATLAKLTAALGLTDNASEDAMVAALDAKLKGRVEKGVHDEALAKLKATSDELAAIKIADRTAKLDALIEGALKSKKITPAEREHYEKLAATEEGFAQVSALFEAMPAKLGASVLDNKEHPEMMGLSEDDYRKANGLTAD